VVVPHGHPTNDTNTEKLGHDLAGELDAFAVINNQEYRKPKTDGNGTLLEQLDLNKKVLDLNDPADASECPRVYLDKILRATKAINRRGGNPALVFFIHGMSDLSADELFREPDIVVGKSFVRDYDPTCASGSELFFKDFIAKLRQKKMGVVRDDVHKYSGKTRMPPFLTWLAARQGLKTEAVQIEFRWRRFRRTDQEIRTTAQKFADVVRSLSAYVSWEEGDMVKAPTVVGEDRFNQIMTALDQREKITDDKGRERDFTGELKKEFIGACRTAYPVIKRTYESINEMGKVLGEVRGKLKPLGVYHAWLAFIDLPRRTAQNYVQVHDRYKEHLLDFAHLGIRKLLIASKLEDCANYVAKNLPKIETETADELAKEVAAVLKKTRKTRKAGGGRSSKAMIFGTCSVRASSKGDKITIEGLTAKKQAQLLEAIKKVLSQEKE